MSAWIWIISITSLIIAIIGLFISIKWHGVRGPIGIQGRTGKDVSGELKSVSTALDALKTTVKSNNYTLNSSLKDNLASINKNTSLINLNKTNTKNNLDEVSKDIKNIKKSINTFGTRYANEMNSKVSVDAEYWIKAKMSGHGFILNNDSCQSYDISNSKQQAEWCPLKDDQAGGTPHLTFAAATDHKLYGTAIKKWVI